MSCRCQACAGLWAHRRAGPTPGPGNHVHQHSLLGVSGQDRGVPTLAFWERPLGGHRDLPGRGSIPAKEATSTEFSRPVSFLVADGPVCRGEGSPGRHWVRHEAEGQLGMGLCCLPPAPGLSAGLLAACADICTHAYTRVRAVPLTLTADVSTHIPSTVPPHRPRGLPSVSIAHLHTPGGPMGSPIPSLYTENPVRFQS